MPATLERPKKTVIRLTPQHDGRKMSLAMFDRAIGQPGHTYELGQGVVEVSDIPSFEEHGAVMDYLRGLIEVYRFQTPGVIQYVGGGAEAKAVIESTESERHPDLSVYCQESPGGNQPWDVWVPEIVVEIVSESSRKRDYGVKPAEYLTFGCKEYWLIDPAKNVVVIHSRVGGKWQIKSLSTRQKHKTHILPGFVLDVNKVLGARKSK